MALVYVGPLNVPTYTALSTDIVASKIDGAVRVGATVFIIDTADWYIIEDDLTLADYVLPVALSLAGNVEIGAVSIDQPVASSTTLSPLYGVQAVAVPGTAEPLVGSSTKVLTVTIFTKEGNTSNVYIGTSTVDKTTSKQIVLAPGALVSIDAPLGYNFNLNSWYVDAEVANEGVNYIAMR